MKHTSLLLVLLTFAAAAALQAQGRAGMRIESWTQATKANPRRIPHRRARGTAYPAGRGRSGAPLKQQTRGHDQDGQNLHPAGPVEHGRRGKAEVYMDVGEAMGKAMVELLGKSAK